MAENLDLKVPGIGGWDREGDSAGTQTLEGERMPKKNAGGDGGKDNRRRPAKPGAIEKLIQGFEKALGKDLPQLTVSEYIRLKQLRKELVVEEPKEIRVTWVEPTEKESVTET